MAPGVADEAFYPARPLTFTVSEYFRQHLDNPGCVSCSWSLSPVTWRFALTFISSVCPVHGELPRGRVHPRATQRLRYLVTVPE